MKGRVSIEARSRESGKVETGRLHQCWRSLRSCTAEIRCSKLYRSQPLPVS